MHFDGGGGGGEAAFISSGDIAFSGGIPSMKKKFVHIIFVTNTCKCIILRLNSPALKGNHPLNVS